MPHHNIISLLILGASAISIIGITCYNFKVIPTTKENEKKEIELSKTISKTVAPSITPSVTPIVTPSITPSITPSVLPSFIPSEIKTLNSSITVF